MRQKPLKVQAVLKLFWSFSLVYVTWFRTRENAGDDDLEKLQSILMVQ